MTRPPPKDSHAHRSRNVSSHRDTTGFPKRTMTHSNYTYATSHTHTRSSSSSTSWLNRSVEWQSDQCLVFSMLEGPKSVWAVSHILCNVADQGRQFLVLGRGDLAELGHLSFLALSTFILDTSLQKAWPLQLFTSSLTHPFPGSALVSDI